MRYFLELSYKGTAYNGWQKQPDAPSVQETIEKALSALLREEITITGAGRTDTGVHAAYYTAHFDTATDIESNFRSGKDFIYHLNSILPNDIAVSNIIRVPDDAHARFDAVEREYRYHILLLKDPFRRETTWQYYIPLDIKKMNEAASYLLEAEEFTAFSKLHSANKTDICNVTHARWEEKPNGELVFTIRSDRFLRNMVRSVVGTLVDVGRGKINAEQFAAVLRSKDRAQAGGSAPSQGLFLTDVIYKPGILPARKQGI